MLTSPIAPFRGLVRTRRALYDTPHYASFQDYLTVIRRYRFLVVAMVLLFGGGAYAYATSLDEIYRAEAALSFREPTQGVELIGLPPVRHRTPEEHAAIGAERAMQRRVLEAVRRELQLPLSLTQLEDTTAARAEVRTNNTVISADHEDPIHAARIANAIGEEIARLERAEIVERYTALLESTEEALRRGIRGSDTLSRIQRRQVERQLIQLRSLRDFTVPVVFISRATPPRVSVSPKPIRDTAFGAAAGLLLGLVIAFLRWGLDRRLRSVHEIRDRAQLPVVGVVRRSALGRVALGRSTSRKEAAELDLEGFRIIYAHMEYLAKEPPKRVLVTSAVDEEGKSTVASSLAVVAGMAERKTLLVECDLRRPVLATRLGLPPKPGLVDFLTGAAAPSQVVRVVSVGQTDENASAVVGSGNVIAAITAGSDPQRPTELIRSDRFEHFMTQVSSVYDLVILDCPPLLSVADTLELVEHVDAVILCVRSKQTTRDQLSAALGTLQRLPDRPTGIVVTGIDPGDEGDYGHYTYSYSRADRA